MGEALAYDLTCPAAVVNSSGEYPVMTPDAVDVTGGIVEAPKRVTGASDSYQLDHLTTRYLALRDHLS